MICLRNLAISQRGLICLHFQSSPSLWKTFFDEVDNQPLYKTYNVCITIPCLINNSSFLISSEAMVKKKEKANQQKLVLLLREEHVS